MSEKATLDAEKDHHYCGNCTHLVHRGMCWCYLDEVNPVVRDVGDWCKEWERAKGFRGAV